MKVKVTAYFEEEITPEDYNQFIISKRYPDQPFKEWYIENFNEFNLQLHFEIEDELA